MVTANYIYYIGTKIMIDSTTSNIYFIAKSGECPQKYHL